MVMVRVRVTENQGAQQRGEMTADRFYSEARTWRMSGVGISLVLFCALVWGSLYTVPGQNLDNLTMEALAGRVALLPEGLELATSLVSVPALAVASVFVAAVAVIRRRPALALRSVAVVAGANLSTQVIKALLERPDLGVSLTLANSFPSGHTTFAASIAVALILVAPKGFRSGAAIAGWAWTAVMGVVVISHGWHRLSDVLGSILLVAVWGFLATPIEERDRLLPALTGVLTWTAWIATMGGVGFLLLGLIRLDADLMTPLTQTAIREAVVADSASGIWLSLATILLSIGLSGVLTSGLNRFSGR